MQMVSLLRKLVAPCGVAGELAADGNDRAGVTLIHHDGATLLARYSNRCAIIGSPKNHWFRKCDVVEKFRRETGTHEKLVLLLEAHDQKQRVGASHHIGGSVGRFEPKINSVCFDTFKNFFWPVG